MNEFELVGIINYFDVIPSAVEVIFKDEDGLLYRGINGDDNANITEFELLSEETGKKVIFLEDLVVIKEALLPAYQVGDVMICGFQLDDKRLYIARVDKYIDYMFDYAISIKKDQLLKTEISNQILELKPKLNNDDAHYN